jgi:hypothetical protein
MAAAMAHIDEKQKGAGRISSPPVFTTGKTHCAVRSRTAKTALPCEATTTHDTQETHGKAQEKRTTKTLARQRRGKTHGKATLHGKDGNERTTKKCTTAMAHGVAMS